jgi:hypothetical protein
VKEACKHFPNVKFWLLLSFKFRHQFRHFDDAIEQLQSLIYATSDSITALVYSTPHGESVAKLLSNLTASTTQSCNTVKRQMRALEEQTTTLKGVIENLKSDNAILSNKIKEETFLNEHLVNQSLVDANSKNPLATTPAILHEAPKDSPDKAVDPSKQPLDVNSTNQPLTTVANFIQEAEFNDSASSTEPVNNNTQKPDFVEPPKTLKRKNDLDKKDMLISKNE